MANCPNIKPLVSSECREVKISVDIIIPISATWDGNSLVWEDNRLSFSFSKDIDPMSAKNAISRTLNNYAELGFFFVRICRVGNSFSLEPVDIDL